MLRNVVVVCALIAFVAGCGGGGGEPVAQPQIPLDASVVPVTFERAKLNYVIAQTPTGYTVTDKTTGVGTTVAAGTPQMVFSDAAVLFDATGVEGEAYRLYQAAFDRQPDMGGLGFQIHAVQQVGVVNVANDFLASPEFQQRYGNLSDTAFVTAMYQNVLHRAPDAEGLAYHLANLATGVPRNYVLAGFSESPENKTNVAATIQAGVTYFPFGKTGFTGADEPIVVAPSAEGFWQGQTSTGYTASAVILETGEVWGIYSASNTIYGAVHGQATVNGSSLSLSGLDFNLVSRTVGAGTYAGTFTAKSSMALTNTGNGQTFNGAYQSVYDTPASLASLAGNYSGAAVTGSTLPSAVPVSISSSGAISAGGGSGCAISGQASPRASGKNVFSLSVTFTGADCSLGNGVTVNGVAYLDASAKRLYALALNATQSDGFIFTGVKP